MPYNLEELSKLYKKIRDGKASEFEKQHFEVELEMRSFERGSIIKRIEDHLRFGR